MMDKQELLGKIEAEKPGREDYSGRGTVEEWSE